jgi:methionyl-tRNA formyltransferase
MVTAAPLRIAFFGTPGFAVPTLEALLHSRHKVVAVITQPDRPQGRGQRTAASPVKSAALAANVPVLQPERLKDPLFVDQFVATGAELGVVAAYGRLIPEAVFNRPRLGLINVHASLLPKYRGAAPVHRAVINGEAQTGITIMRIVKALDAGPMLDRTVRPIGREETSEEVEADLARLGADLLVATVERLAEGAVEEVPQDESSSTYASRLVKTDGVVDWTLPAQRIHDLIRGLFPWPHAFTYWKDRRVILLRSSVAEAPLAGEPGTVLESRTDGIRVATGSGVLSLRELQLEGKRPMDVREFLAGYRIAPGERFAPGP